MRADPRADHSEFYSTKHKFTGLGISKYDLTRSNRLVEISAPRKYTSTKNQDPSQSTRRPHHHQPDSHKLKKGIAGT